MWVVINMEKPNRKPNRLPNFDYAKCGSYFITICTKDKKSLFEIENDTVGNGPVPFRPNVQCAVTHLPNKIIHKWIIETQNEFPNAKIEKYVVMPNHIHMIVTITERHDGRSLREIMHYFKTMTTNEYISYVKNGLLPPFDKKIWQKSYYDHIIRNDADYIEKWNYIDNNPIKWEMNKNDQGD